MSTPGPTAAASQPRPHSVCICGSLQFPDQILAAAIGEWQAGHRVYAPTRQPQIPAAEHARRHRQQILAADEVLVVAAGGYLGDATRSEIAFATEHGIPVRYWPASANTPPPTDPATTSPAERTHTR